MKQIIIDSEAENELSDSVTFYERREPGLDLEFERAAREAVQTIQACPEHDPLQKDGIRRLIMERFPFVIHYADLPSTIWILDARLGLIQPSCLGVSCRRLPEILPKNATEDTFPAWTTMILSPSNRASAAESPVSGACALQFRTS